MMKRLTQIIFTFAMVIGLAFSVSAQKDDQKNRPPKDPPKVDPGKKPPRGNPPKGDDKPKKPGMSFYLVTVKKESDTV
jgi:hypothetical protein